MKTKNSIKNLISVLLFASFLFTYFLDFTGLNLHQWLGIAAAVATALHLLLHWNWVKAVTTRFFSQTSGQARSFYLLDVLLFTGLAVITLTGLAISSWFSLAVSSYEFWRQIHVAASVVAMAVLVIKLALHWKYIAAMFKPARVARSAAFNPAESSARSEDPKMVSRREALRVIGTVSVVGLVGILKAASALRSVEAVALPQPALSTQVDQTANSTAPGQITAASPTAGVQPTAAAQLPLAPAADQQTSQSSENCVVRCDKDCSYPGRCRRYTDTNNNQRCDLGECLAI
jgi:cytochrome b